jgi:Na+/proline symporter
VTAIVLAAVYTSFQPTASAESVVVFSTILIGIVMIIFTYYGGMEAVIWIEVVQLGIYVFGAIAAAVVLSNSIDGGFARAMELGAQYGKFSFVDWGFRPTAHTFTSVFTFETFQITLPFDFTKTYTLLGGRARRLFPDDEHARHGSISSAALPLH